MHTAAVYVNIMENVKQKKPCDVNNCERFRHSSLRKTDILRNTEVTTHVKEIHPNIPLKILPIKIRGPNGTFDVTALLDEGSTATLIESDTATKIGLYGPTSPFCYKWKGEVYHFEDDSQIVETEIAGKNNTSFYKLRNIRTIKNLDLPV
ncbi:unnamed protein product [Psylliodes chrysocephalus]|uniref:Uncharacterized protein n=1 Tax=Psylliodes chrysocephalus TaxID=3402493 RepID=A0A9P0GMS0_9CUCU|nr:unnamed protein product [Psylliodes chrysocephala]